MGGVATVVNNEWCYAIVKQIVLVVFGLSLEWNPDNLEHQTFIKKLAVASLNQTLKGLQKTSSITSQDLTFYVILSKCVYKMHKT